MKRINEGSNAAAVRLRCLSCNQWTSNRCNHCQTAPYCNQRCWQMQKELHKKVCFPLLGDRLCSVFSYAKVNNISLTNLSASVIIRDRSVSAFSQHNSEHCAVCEINLNETSGGGTIIYVYFHNHLIYYRRCLQCTKMNRKLCQVSLMESEKCRKVYSNRKAFYIFLNRTFLYPEFPPEIVLYILSWFMRIARVSICNH